MARLLGLNALSGVRGFLTLCGTETDGLVALRGLNALSGVRGFLTRTLTGEKPRRSLS